MSKSNAPARRVAVFGLGGTIAMSSTGAGGVVPRGSHGWIGTDETGSTGIVGYAGRPAGYVVGKAGASQGWLTPVPDEPWTYGYHVELAHFIDCLTSPVQNLQRRLLAAFAVGVSPRRVLGGRREPRRPAPGPRVRR